MKIGVNLFVGLISSIWTALVGLAVVPFYLKYLGAETYGLIGFYVTTQAVLYLLDVGMAPTINREVARCSASGDVKEAGKLLHTMAVIYWITAVVIAILIMTLAPFISEHWLKSKQLPVQTILNAITLMGFVIACRWPVGLYLAAINGAQRLAVSGSITIIMTTASSLGAVAVMAYISPTIEAFFIWQVCTALLYTLITRTICWKIIGRLPKLKFNFTELKNIWRFSVSVSAVSLMAVIFTQMDKLLLSKYLSLDEFAHYMLATVIVSGIYVSVAPVYNVIYPKFCMLLEDKNSKELELLYSSSSRLLSSLIFPAAMILSVFSFEIISLWTGNDEIAHSISPIISIMVIGTVLNGILFVPHALQLASGMTKFPLIINATLMIFYIPMLMNFSQKYGAAGGAVTWTTLHISYLIFSTFLTHRYLIKTSAKKWLFVDIGVPFGITLISAFICFYFIEKSELTNLLKLFCGCLIAALSFLINVLISPKSFSMMIRKS